MDRRDVAILAAPGRKAEAPKKGESGRLNSATAFDPADLGPFVETDVESGLPVSASELDAIEALLGAELKAFTQ